MNSRLRVHWTVTPIAILTAVTGIFAAQMLSSAPFTEGIPLEFGEGAALLALSAASFLMALTAQDPGYRHALAWNGIGVAFAALFAGTFAGFGHIWPDRLAADDIPTLLAWAITGFALRYALGHPRLLPAARNFLLTGFALQSLAFLGDLGNGTLFHFPHAFESFTLSAGDFCNLAGLGVYLCGLLLMSLPLLGGPFAAAENAAEAGIKAYNRLMAGPGRYVAIGIEDVRYALWRLRNPKAEFSSYYADVMCAALDRGRGHVHLGRRQWVKSVLTSSKGKEWTADDFAGRGREIYERLTGYTTIPPRTVVEYGCGSLRVGQHFIRTLDAGHFWGLDVTDRFYNDGLALLGAETVADKQPHVAVIDDEALAAARAARPDLVYSIAVLRFVPPVELEIFWRRLLSLMAAHTLAVVEFQMAPSEMRILGKDWAYSEADIRAVVETVLPGAAVRIELLPREGKPDTAWKRAAAIISAEGCDQITQAALSPSNTASSAVRAARQSPIATTSPS